MLNFAVYSQPAYKAKLWADRGCRLAVKAERQPDGQGHPTVTIESWDAAWNAVNVKRIREPLDDPKVDVGDTNLLAWLYPQDEPDNLVVEYHDNAKDPEQVYVALEQWAAKMRSIDPNRKLAANFGIEQSRWPGKVDYARLLKPLDYAIGDYYPILRGMTVPDGVAVVQNFSTQFCGGPVGKGGKFLLWFVEGSWQNQSYGSGRGPTPIEMLNELDGAVYTIGVYPGIFPQQPNGSPLNEWGQPFVEWPYDAMGTERLAALTSWLLANASAAPPPLPVYQTTTSGQTPPTPPDKPKIQKPPFATIVSNRRRSPAVATAVLVNGSPKLLSADQVQRIDAIVAE